jgi:hypothetical protein
MGYTFSQLKTGQLQFFFTEVAGPCCIICAEVSKKQKSETGTSPFIYNNKSSTLILIRESNY